MTDGVRQEVERIVGYAFADPTLIERALTHASLADRRELSNERMEFLGDSVLGFVVCQHLFRRYPNADEGDLTKIKSYLVSRAQCAGYAHEAGLVGLLSVGKGFGGQTTLPQSVAAAVFEAIIAAIYLDAGLESAEKFVMQFVGPHVDSTERMGHHMNFKSILQQVAQGRRFDPPNYVVLDEKGPDHAKAFEVAVVVGTRRFPSCWGPSKKIAEQAAALVALRELGHAQGEDPSVVIVWPASSGNQASTARESASATDVGEPEDPSTTESASDA